MNVSLSSHSSERVSAMGYIWIIIRTSSGHKRLLFPVPHNCHAVFGPACVSAGGSAVFRRPALQLQPPRAGCSPAEAPLLRECPKEGPPEADPHDDRGSLRPQWTHCYRGGPNWGLGLCLSRHKCFVSVLQVLLFKPGKKIGCFFFFSLQFHRKLI